MTGMQIVVKFYKDDNMFLKFDETPIVQHNPDSVKEIGIITDENYEYMIKSAILALEEWRIHRKFRNNTQMSTLQLTKQNPKHPIFRCKNPINKE